ncbi:MAG TPA: DUF368 domain-containing protein [Treponemataceae bacterium]|nr:DUF368 domain-containing protein [Treponemataceae bacterium]
MILFKLFCIGVLLGISNVIPGVSGGTIAVVFGVYDRIISLISFNIKKLFSEWKFLLPLLFGLATGIFFFSKTISTLYVKYPILTNWFFIGLIAGSIPLLLSKISTSQRTEKSSNTINKLSVEKKPFPFSSTIVSFLLALSIMILTMLLTPETQNTAPQTVFSITLALKLIVAGALAAIAMIIPGISGSFFMLIIGMYTTVLAAVANVQLSLLAAIAIGVLAGLLIGAKSIRFVMKKAPTQTYAAIMGLVIGSLIVLFPGFGSLCQIAVSSISCIAGFSLAYFSSRNEIKSKYI